MNFRRINSEKGRGKTQSLADPEAKKKLQNFSQENYLRLSGMVTSLKAI